MILKVDPDELLDVTKVMKKDVERFNKEIANMEGSLEKIRNNWKGVDADAFTTNFANFIKKMKAIPNQLKHYQRFVIRQMKAIQQEMKNLLKN